MPRDSIEQFLGFPGLDIHQTVSAYGAQEIRLYARTQRRALPCPRCNAMTCSTYDHRVVRVRDEPVRNRKVVLEVTKRRLRCRACRVVFTEPLAGVLPRRRFSERFARAITQAADNYRHLNRVCKDFACSSGFVYTTVFRHLELARRTRLYPWPVRVGLDEHFFGRDRQHWGRIFSSMVVDHDNKRLFEVVRGRTNAELEAALGHIPGRERVRYVTIDMSDSYRSFVRGFFPKATIIADKFHVLRLLSPALVRRRKELAKQGQHQAPGRQVTKLLLRSRERLDFWQRLALDEWLDLHPVLRELYDAKEALHTFYRARGVVKAAQSLHRLTERLARSVVPELQTLRRTLTRWRMELLAHFATGLTNARTEGFNAKAKLAKRCAFGYRNFSNYRLRILNACNGS
jgi:transposase